MSETVIFRDDVSVELIKSSASDADVIWAARVSTAGELSLDEIGEDPARSAGLINYLARERHGSPFEHTSMTFFISAPIFVFREFMRHRIASYNEESGRYRELKPVFYIPSKERKLVQVGKTGAYTFEDGTTEQFEISVAAMKEAYVVAYDSYIKMLEAGVAREVARVVLPVATYSSMYVTMNARALMNFLSLRTAREGSHFPSYPQREIEMVAEKMEAEFAKLMPLTYGAFEKSGRIAPLVRCKSAPSLKGAGRHDKVSKCLSPLLSGASSQQWLLHLLKMVRSIGMVLQRWPIIWQIMVTMQSLSTEQPVKPPQRNHLKSLRLLKLLKAL